MKEHVSEIILKAGITPTPVRILIAENLLNSSSPLSMTELETALMTVDKSTISRTLSIFRKHRLIHAINDASGALKYEICSATSEKHDDYHVHFHCEKCGSTICLNEIAVPEVKLPEGFEMHEANYIVTGICGKCAK